MHVVKAGVLNHVVQNKATISCPALEIMAPLTKRLILRSYIQALLCYIYCPEVSTRNFHAYCDATGRPVLSVTAVSNTDLLRLRSVFSDYIQNL